MNTQEQHSFCSDLAEVMRKHGVIGLAGCWFGKPGRGLGVVDLCSPTDFDLKLLVNSLSAEMKEKMQSLRPGVEPKHTRGLHLDGDEKKLIFG